MKLLFVIHSLTTGGAEKVLLNLVKELDKDRYNITLFTIHNYGIYVEEAMGIEGISYKYLFPHYRTPGIRRRFWGVVSIFGDYMLKLLPASFLHRALIRDTYDVEIAYLEGDATKLVSGSEHMKTIKLAWLHTDVSKNSWASRFYRSEAQEKKTYGKFDRIISVSQGVKEAFERKNNMSSTVLYNVIDDKDILQKSREPCKVVDQSEFNFICVGKLIPVKGYDRLLRCCRKLQDDGIRFKLWIVGEGGELRRLQNVIKNSRLEECIRLLGFQKNPYKYISRCDVLVCASLAEGMSSVVTEALILGVPVLTTDCAGMRELLGNSEFGYICRNSEEGVYDAMKLLSTDRCLLNSYREKSEIRGEFIKAQSNVSAFERLIVSEDVLHEK